MTVEQYIMNNERHAMITIRMSRKNYLCSWVEAIKYFGNKEIKRITMRDSESNLVTIK